MTSRLTRFLASAVAASLLAVAAPAFARLTEAEAARLGADLTPGKCSVCNERRAR